MLIDEIKKANLQAMKDRDHVKRAIFSIVINKYMNAAIEAKIYGKEITDADVLNIIQKTCKELDDEAAGYEKVGNVEKLAETATQKSCIETFLPKQLTEDEIKEIIDKLEDKKVSSIMKHFKTNYAGQVDMSLVSKIARSL